MLDLIYRGLLHLLPRSYDGTDRAEMWETYRARVEAAEAGGTGRRERLVEISDLLGAVVSGDTASSRSPMGFPSGHPRYLGALRRPIDATEPSATSDMPLLATTGSPSSEKMCQE